MDRAVDRARGTPAERPLLCSNSLDRCPRQAHFGHSSALHRPRLARGLFVRRDCKDPTMEIEIGRGKKARQAYGFDDIAIVPSRRTRDPDDIDISWKLGPYQFELPMLASAMDGVVSPETAGDRRRSRWPGGAQPRGHIHPLRGRRGAAGADRPAAQGGGHARDAGDLLRAGQARADRPADRGDQGAEGRRRRLTDASARARLLRAGAGGGPGRARDPGDGRLRANTSRRCPSR